MEPRDSKRPEGGAGPPEHRPSSEADLRPTLENVKPPREWRSVRDDPSRAIPPPRVVARVHAAESESPAGSRALVADAPSSGPQPQVVEPRFDPEFEPGAETLPAEYGNDRLVLLVRDPWWIYAWWELTQSTLDSGRRSLGAPSDLALRVYDISTIDWDGRNHHAYFDIDVHDRASNWYIELGKPGASFCAEIGLRTSDGRFLALVRSNVVTLPRDGMSHVVDEEWMIVEEDFRRLFDLAGGGSIGLGSGDIQRMLEQRLRSELASGGVSSFGLSSPAVRRTS